MNYFHFTNIATHRWLTVTIMAEDIATAVKKFNNIWGEHVRYDVRGVDTPPVASQVLA